MRSIDSKTLKKILNFKILTRKFWIIILVKSEDLILITIVLQDSYSLSTIYKYTGSTHQQIWGLKPNFFFTWFELKFAFS